MGLKSSKKIELVGLANVLNLIVPVAPILFSLLLVPLQAYNPNSLGYVNFILEKSLSQSL